MSHPCQDFSAWNLMSLSPSEFWDLVKAEEKQQQIKWNIIIKLQKEMLFFVLKAGQSKQNEECISYKTKSLRVSI